MVRSSPKRIDKEFDEVLNKLRAERFLSGIDGHLESPRRLTKVIARMIKENENVQHDLLNVNLENDRKKRGGRRIKI